jgi:5'/3'-nucleotidase SurE
MLASALRLGTAFLYLSYCTSALRILHSNDDGWAGIVIRTVYLALDAAGHDVILSAPAEDQSGTGKQASISFGFLTSSGQTNDFAYRNQRQGARSP